MKNGDATQTDALKELDELLLEDWSDEPSTVNNITIHVPQPTISEKIQNSIPPGVKKIATNKTVRAVFYILTTIAGIAQLLREGGLFE